MKFKSSTFNLKVASNLLAVLILSFCTASQAWSQEAEEGFAPIIDAPAPQIIESSVPADTQAGSGSSPEGSAPVEGGVQQMETSAPATPATIHRAPENDAHAGEEYAPNYLKVWKNPFGTQTSGSQDNSDDENGPITVKPLTPIQRLALSRKLSGSKLYLPERILIGESSKFTVKGPPNWRVAIAMADRDEGAKQINNRKVRLGPDRKVVAIGKIPATGVLELFVATPIQGDLIGSYLFFEAALWSKDDLSDTELADTVAPVLAKNPNTNGVQITTLTEKKRGVRFVPDATIPMSQNMDAGSLSSGQP